MVSIARTLNVAAVGLFTVVTTLTAQQHYKQTNLVSDLPGMAAVTDPNMKNAWGMSRSSASPWWVSDNGTGITTLYTGAGAAVPLGQTCPAGTFTNCVIVPSGDMKASPTGTPTGQVFNGTTDFQLTAGNPAKFIFVTEDGVFQELSSGALSPVECVGNAAKAIHGRIQLLV